MKLARVIGTLVSTIKHETYQDCTLQFVQPVDDRGRPVDSAFLAVDAAQAGVGDYVLVVEEGKSARQVLGKEKIPCEAFIVGVVDYVMIGGKQKALRPERGK